MPRGIPGSGVKSVRTPEPNDENVSAWDPDEVEDMMVGVPETITAINLERIAGDDPALPKPPGLIQPGDGKVMLLNLKYENEKVWIPVADENNVPRFVGDTVLEFIDGAMVCTELQAAFVKRVCPYVFEEPKEGDILTFTPTGFKTRLPAALNEHARLWGERQ